MVWDQRIFAGQGLLSVPGLEPMRKTKTLLTVMTVVLLGSTPASSLNTPRAVSVQSCKPHPSSGISLIGSKGAFDLVLIAADACRE